jgi:hypothetical protein
MSINMYLTVDGKEVSLWQTPTYITYMCMTTDNGVFEYELTGKQAKAAIARYFEWVSSHADGVFQSSEEADSMRSIVKEHINAVRHAIMKAKRVVVYAM